VRSRAPPEVSVVVTAVVSNTAEKSYITPALADPDKTKLPARLTIEEMNILFLI
jgi:hypothetical protein